MKIPRLGPTHRFPQGKVGVDDEGEIRCAVAADHQHAIVRVAFGKPIAWIGLPSTKARELARMLTEKADELDARRT